MAEINKRDDHRPPLQPHDFCVKRASNERIAAEEKTYNCERGVELALAKYEKALIRYGWDIA